MAVLVSKDKNEMILSCNCGCDEGIRVRVDKDNLGSEFYYQTYISGTWYKEQEGHFLKKLKKIWAIIRNKDFYYSEICLSKEEFERYRKWLNEL